MTSLRQFFERIARRLFLTPQRLSAIESLDPSHIYVENVRSIFGITTALAARLCELAVRQRILQKHVEVLCPDSSVAAQADSEEKLPSVVACWEDEDDAPVEREYTTTMLRKVSFYVFTGATEIPE